MALLFKCLDDRITAQGPSANFIVASNRLQCHENIATLTPAEVYLRRGQTILFCRTRVTLALDVQMCARAYIDFFKPG